MSRLHPIRTFFFLTCRRLDATDGIKLIRAHNDRLEQLMFNPKAWEAHKSLLVEDHLITCLQRVRNDSFEIGARYKVPFSHRFPHFEVCLIILVNSNF